MPDRLFEDPQLAVLYDDCCRRQPSDDYDFYLDRVMRANAVLDIGCGTGTLLVKAREERHKGRLVGIDPARAMLQQAAEKRSDIDWLLGDGSSRDLAGEFDLVVMTGHAFQVLVTDEQVMACLAKVASVLTKSGRLAFETRNPKYRAWESWTRGNATTVTDGHGSLITMWNEVETPMNGDLVSFKTLFTSPGWAQPRISHSTLRFLGPTELDRFLRRARLEVTERYGNWDGSPFTDASPEIITIAGPHQ